MSKKDAFNQQKLIDKATLWLKNPSKNKQVKKRGVGRFININDAEIPKKLNNEK